MATLQAGCNKPSPTSEVHARLSRLGLLYGMYSSQHAGQPPKNLKAFQEFVGQQTASEDLVRLGVDDIEDLFVSPRDGQPIQFVALPKMPQPGPESEIVVLHERDGLEGVRVVAFLGGGTAEMRADEFSKAVNR